MVCELTGSKSCLATIYGVNSIPTILFQTFEGALVEFFDKKAIVILCDIGLSLNQAASRIFELIGLRCAGFIIGLLESGGAIIIDDITFFNSVSLFFREITGGICK